MKPAASVRQRLLLAGAIWAVVGTMLAVAGAVQVVAAGWLAAASLPAAIGVGWLKGRYLLAPRAQANALRIVRAGDGRCAGGVYSWASWAFVAAMVALGAILRRSPVPPVVTGWVSLAVGTALVAAAPVPWRHRRAQPVPAPPPRRA